MNKQIAKEMLEKTFGNNFNNENFIQFIKELFNKFEDCKKECGEDEIPKDFKEFIDSYSLFGRYEDSEGKSIEVLAVKLKKNNPESARTMQRNFIAKHLAQRNVNAALVAFYGEEIDNWRFSFVKLEYHLEKDEKGNIKPTTSLTPTKRYSFLVGKTEPSHTAQSRFLELLIREDANPTISEIESSFSVEKVTKEFFEKYKELFLELEESLNKIIKNDKDLAKEFTEKGISTVDFTKKLLGQIVFLYFLQKKGWLGIEKDEKGRFKEWGTGPKDFLKKLYNREIINYNNFFNDILEPLFYEALAIERENDYYSKFRCKIPFLNGGLFEPLGGYNWTNVDILLDDKIFEKIIETFDLYNFTVKEDEPLEREVAIDPEMLGKVFENLLEIKDRKSKGSYYTPREIVHYMCQESLINYLETKTGIDRKYIENFIHNGEISNLIRDNYDKIDKSLKDIKVVDPAIGSGAFPVGMMTEIIKARNILTEFFPKKEQSKRTVYNFKRECIEDSLYGVDIDPGAVDIAQLRLWLSLIVDETDLHKIKPLPNLDYKIMCGNSLLEEFEGIKLFDERLLGEMKKEDSFEVNQIDNEISVLNNQKGEIAQGKLSNGKTIKDINKEIKKLSRKKKGILSIQKSERNSTFGEILDKKVKESQKKLKELKELHKQFFNENNRKEKIELRKQIERLEWEFMEESIKEKGDKEALKRLEAIKKTRSKPFFLWKLYFAEVFQRENPGFDVVIANPPYVGEKGHKGMFQEIKNGCLGKFYHGQMDLFYFFFHLALNISRIHSKIAFITTNYYPTARGARRLREDFKERASILNLINFNELKIFESALGQHNMITILSKINDLDSLTNNIITKRTGTADDEIFRKIFSWKDDETEYYTIKQKDIYEGEENYIRFTGISLNSNNPIQKILQKIVSSGEPLINLCNVNVGLYTGADKVTQGYIQRYNLNLEEGEGIFVISQDEKKLMCLNNSEKDKIVPFFKNSDISKYRTNNFPTKYLINVSYPQNKNLNNFPNIKNHLWKYDKILKNRRSNDNGLQAVIKRGYWWSFTIRQIDFNKPKIVVPQRSKSNTFGYNESPWYASADIYFITQKEKDVFLKYVLSLLNSRLYYLWLYYKGKKKGEMLELYQKPLSEVPIKNIPEKDQKPFIEIVNRILSITDDEDYLNNKEKQAKVREYEKEIDQLVYKLYELTLKEIKIVENFNKEKESCF